MTWAQKITHVYNDKAGGVTVLGVEIGVKLWSTAELEGLRDLYNVSNKKPGCVGYNKPLR